MGPQGVGFVMVSALLIAGIVSVFAGLLAIVYGASVQAFSLGNTLIWARVTVFDSGVAEVLAASCDISRYDD